MADRLRHIRHLQTANRTPLSEVPSRANTPSSSQQNQKTLSTSPGALPHNESLVANGSLDVRTPPATSPGHHRVSAIVKETGRESKRDSQISQASTNASDGGRATGQKRKTHIGHWQLGKTIGTGGCSKVRMVRHKQDLQQYGAVKIISRTVAEITRAQSLANLIESCKDGSGNLPSSGKPIPCGLEREIAVMKLLEHPNIVRLYDVWENRNELYIIMEYVPGCELFTYIDVNKGLDEVESVYIFRQIVAALLYCHRLHICHRDLKPENILLNPETLEVKLIDFGMAALQPEGKFLSTPCGSPHYAAPEVISSRPYDGTRSDVWSCGVILFVTLTGTTPYNYGPPPENNVKPLFQAIAKARYHMPPDFSFEAKDLIRRIFVTSPKQRVTADDVWDHPLLHKYDKAFNFVGPDGTKEAAIGPTPKIEDWTVSRIQDIDREILRNMRVLWHSVPEQGLIQKLLSPGYNQEKLFYAALLKHREENMENYIGSAEAMGYSASDYHHSKPTAVPRSQSAYSIMNDEHLRTNSFAEPTLSVSSYDPYRASRDPIVNGKNEYLNVTVHRGGSNGSKRPSIGRSLRHPNSLRVEMLKHGSRRSSNQSQSSLPKRGGHSRASLQRSSMSRHSMTSSVWPSSPPVIATWRPSDSHRRGVSFGRINRTSTTSVLTGQDSTMSLQNESAMPNTSRNSQRAAGSTLLGGISSPATHIGAAVRSRKENRGMENSAIKVRKPETPSHYIRSEVRKVSTELEKACQEAFFRDSIGSSTTTRTSITDKPGPYDTPPSSIDNREFKQLPLDPSLIGRPLPAIPADTPNTYLSRLVEETRDKVAAYKSDGAENTAKFDELLGMLDKIVPSAKTPDKRAVSAPEPKTPDHLGFLPMISEEARSDDPRASRDGNGNWHRAVTSPVMRKGKAKEEKTVRIVEASSPGAVLPLNIRKHSDDSNNSYAASTGSRYLRDRQSQERLHAQRSNDRPGLDSIVEDALPAIPSEPVKKKKSGWFQRLKNQIDEETNKSGRTSIPSSWRELDDRNESKASPKTLTKAHRPVVSQPIEEPLSSDSSELPMREDKGKRGFSKWFGRRSGDKKDGGRISAPAQADHSAASLFSTTSIATSSIDAEPTGPERSWFARFLHICPATKILCFSIPRGRARQELVILLREWQRHGVRDIVYSRQTNTITARVDKQNSLDIKPVTFRIELFIVLEHGRKVGLCIARFSQVKGAASGFRRVLDVVEGVMRGRGWMIEDEEKWKALCEIVGG